MTDRERLIELIGSTHYGIATCSTIKVNFQHGFIEKIADHLLSNGVTFATDTNVGGKWISVSEKLPEEGRTVLCYRTQGDMRTAELLGVHPRLKSVVAFTNREWNTVFTATHWLPIPELPKEGE